MFNTLSISREERLLVVAPHPDDETVGCGGLLARFGEQCDVLLLTDGRKGLPADGSRTEEETAALRRQEFDAVMTRFGVRSTQALAIPDGNLAKQAAAVSGVDLRQYDRIFVPFRLERHPDHAAAYRIIQRLHRRQRARAELLEYEVWSPITAPNRFLDISELMEQKLAAIRRYASQTQELDYEALAVGLNGYRGAPHRLRFCEAYYTEAASKQERLRSGFARLPRWLRRALLWGKNRWK